MRAQESTSSTPVGVRVGYRSGTVAQRFEYYLQQQENSGAVTTTRAIQKKLGIVPNSPSARDLSKLIESAVLNQRLTKLNTRYQLPSALKQPVLALVNKVKRSADPDVGDNAIAEDSPQHQIAVETLHAVLFNMHNSTRFFPLPRGQWVADWATLTTPNGIVQRSKYGRAFPAIDPRYFSDLVSLGFFYFLDKKGHQVTSPKYGQGLVYTDQAGWSLVHKLFLDLSMTDRILRGLLSQVRHHRKLVHIHAQRTEALFSVLGVPSPLHKHKKDDK